MPLFTSIMVLMDVSCLTLPFFAFAFALIFLLVLDLKIDAPPPLSSPHALRYTTLRCAPLICLSFSLPARPTRSSR